MRVRVRVRVLLSAYVLSLSQRPTRECDANLSAVRVHTKLQFLQHLPHAGRVLNA